MSDPTSSPMGTTTATVETPQGPARLHIDRVRGSLPASGTVVLGHGAGGGVGARDLVALAQNLPTHGFDVVRVEQPWRVAGRRIAGPPAHLDEAWHCCLDALDAQKSGESKPVRLVVGGRSAGARVAFRCALARPVAGVLALAFPLHPPQRPERSRRPEIGSSVPALVVQGSRDAYGHPEEFRPLPDNVVIMSIPGADHSFVVGKRAQITQLEADQLLVDSTLVWLKRVMRESSPPS